MSAFHWELIQPHTDADSEQRPCAGDGRPTTIGGSATGVVDGCIYIFGGWGHKAPLPPTMDTAVLSRQLWCHDTRSATWRRIEPQSERASWPAKRYVSACTTWEGRIYLWGARDTQDRDPQFYNDLWVGREV